MTTIRYFVTKRDLFFACVLSVFRSAVLWTFCAIFSLYISYDNFSNPNLFKYNLQAKIIICSAWTLGVFIWMFGIVLVGNLIRTLARDKRGVLGEHRLSVSDEGLTESTAYNENFIRWTIYHKTVKTSGYLMLYPNTFSSHVISRKRPLLEGNLEEFESALRERAKAAKD